MESTSFLKNLLPDNWGNLIPGVLAIIVVQAGVWIRRLNPSKKIEFSSKKFHICASCLTSFIGLVIAWYYAVVISVPQEMIKHIPEIFVAMAFMEGAIDVPDFVREYLGRSRNDV